MKKIITILLLLISFNVWSDEYQSALDLCYNQYKASNDTVLPVESANVFVFEKQIIYILQKGVRIFGKETKKNKLIVIYKCVSTTTSPEKFFFQKDMVKNNVTAESPIEDKIRNNSNSYDFKYVRNYIMKKEKFYFNKQVKDREKEYYKNNPQFYLHPSLN
ncbi:hypothetical protein [uncultured Shewanella sp.]|uniref:hypothetical protein n=1 Tax=uncultured Shewanella sp. TaxID=173975 RepID=UPI002638C77F|nr:hypothetical protein [uncultured Shewanella sp.]